jgi:predicted nucleotidyltransferase
LHPFQKEQNPNQIEIDLINDVCDFYIKNYQEVNEEYKIDKKRCKSLFEYIFTAFDAHIARNWSMSLSDVMGSFKNFKPQD